MGVKSEGPGGPCCGGLAESGREGWLPVPQGPTPPEIAPGRHVTLTHSLVTPLHTQPQAPTLTGTCSHSQDHPIPTLHTSCHRLRHTPPTDLPGLSHAGPWPTSSHTCACTNTNECSANTNPHSRPVGLCRSLLPCRWLSPSTYMYTHSGHTHSPVHI